MTQSLRKLAVLCATFVASISLTFAQAPAGDKPKIGFSIEAMKGERWQTDLASFEKRAQQLGAEVISNNANGDDDLQLQQVKEMIKRGIKVLVLLPHDTTKAGQIVDAAKAAKVKVISYDRLAQNSDVDLYISFDRPAMGRMQAEYLLHLAPKGNYVLIAGSPNDEGAKVLHDEQMEVLKPYVDRGDVKIVGDSYTKEWLPSEAYVHMLAAIEASKGDIAAVVSSNDGMATGAIQALRDRGLARKVLVSGQDADLANIICLAEGTQTMTIYKPIAAEATRAAEEAVRLAKGEKANADGAVNNGKNMVPSILLKPVLVTKDNIKATVVQDGFETLKEINLGLPADKQIR